MKFEHSTPFLPLFRPYKSWGNPIYESGIRGEILQWKMVETETDLWRVRPICCWQKSVFWNTLTCILFTRWIVCMRRMSNESKAGSRKLMHGLAFPVHILIHSIAKHGTYRVTQSDRGRNNFQKENSQTLTWSMVTKSVQVLVDSPWHIDGEARHAKVRQAHSLHCFCILFIIKMHCFCRRKTG